MRYSTKEVTVRLIIHFLGYGACEEHANKKLTVPIKHLEPATFIKNYIDETIRAGDATYKYYDIIMEKKELKGNLSFTVYVRYILDTEALKFKDFLDRLEPSDFDF